MELKFFDYPQHKPPIPPGFDLCPQRANYAKLVRLSNELGFDWYAVYSHDKKPKLLRRYFADYALYRLREEATEIRLYESDHQQAIVPSGYVEAPASEHGRLAVASKELGFCSYAVMWMPATERSRPGPLLLRRYFANCIKLKPTKKRKRSDAVKLELIGDTL